MENSTWNYSDTAFGTAKLGSALIPNGVSSNVEWHIIMTHKQIAVHAVAEIHNLGKTRMHVLYTKPEAIN